MEKEDLSRLLKEHKDFGRQKLSWQGRRFRQETTEQDTEGRESK